MVPKDCSALVAEGNLQARFVFMITLCLLSVLALGKNGDGHIAAAPSERKLHRQGTTVPVTAVPHMRCDPHHFGRHGTSPLLERKRPPNFWWPKFVPL